MTLAVDMGITAEQADWIRKEFQVIEDRIFERRVENDIPSSFTKHKLELFNSRTSVYLTVDQCTSGRWAYIKVREGGMNGQPYEVIAFEDPKDMTMFLMAYTPREPLRRE